MNLLSIIILFCDKDVQYLSQILADIRKYVHVSYEIILVDNRDNDKSELPIGKYKLTSKGHNVYQFEGRRMGLDLAQGKYVWYVDVDDAIINNIEESDFLKKGKADIIQFYTKDASMGHYIRPQTNHDKGLLYFGEGRLWGRFIKTATLKRLLRPIKRDIIFMGYEDVFLLDLLNDNINFLEFIDKVIYEYKVDRSTRREGFFTQEKFELLETGIENLEYLASFLKDPESFIGKVTIFREALQSKIK